VLDRDVLLPEAVVVSHLPELHQVDGGAAADQLGPIQFISYDRMQITDKMYAIRVKNTFTNKAVKGLCNSIKNLKFLSDDVH
jgi:hypothetical protein